MSIMSGHGATLGFGTTTTYSPGYTSIGGFSASRESLDTSTLATTGARTKIGGDLFDVGSFSCDFLIDIAAIDAGASNAMDDLLFDSGDVTAAETVTVTYPTADSATCAGTANVLEWGIGDAVTDTLMTGSLVIEWSDWPTFADNAA